MTQLRRVVLLSLCGLSLMTGLVAGGVTLQAKHQAHEQFAYLGFGMLLVGAALVCVKSNYWLSVPTLLSSFLAFVLFLLEIANVSLFQNLTIGPIAVRPLMLEATVMITGFLVLGGLLVSIAVLNRPLHWITKGYSIATLCVGIYAISELTRPPSSDTRFSLGAILVLCQIGCAIVFIHGYQHVEQTRPTDQLFEGIKLGCPRCSTVFVAPLGCMACPQCMLVLTVAVEETKELGIG